MDNEQIRQIIREELSAFLKNDKFVFNKLVTFLDGRNIQLGRTTGTMIGTEGATYNPSTKALLTHGQKLSFYGMTPTEKQAPIDYPNGGTVIDYEARSIIGDLINALKNIGITQ
jgi:hypothetical protein